MDQSLLIVIVGAVTGFILFIGILASNYRKAGPDEAIIKFGSGGIKPIVGGATFVIPVLQRYDRISLELISIDVKVQNAYSREGIPVNIDAVANVKINSEDAALRRAVERFLGKDKEEIKRTIQETLEGQLRDIIGTLTVPQLYKERDEFVGLILEQTGKELDKIGVQIDIINIQTISDTKNYLENLGRREAARVLAVAEIGEAEANRDSVKQSAIANKEGQVEKAGQEKEIFEAQKIRDVAKAQYDGETLKARAFADQEGPMADAQARQNVIREQVKVKEEEQLAEQRVENARIIKEENKYKADVVVPASADKQRQIEIATGKAEAIKLEASANAEAVKKVGQAEADVIRAKALAEAEGIEKKAEAWKRFGSSANLMNVLKTQQMISEDFASAAANMKMDNVVWIGGNEQSNSGLSNALNTLPAAIVKMNEQLKAMTGIDLEESLKKLVDKTIDPSESTNKPSKQTKAPEKAKPKPPEKK